MKIIKNQRYINVQCVDKWRRIRAITRNGLALHPTVTKKKSKYVTTWEVTHIASGRRLNWNTDRYSLPLQMAKKYFRELRALNCWHVASTEEMTRHQRRDIARIAEKYGMRRHK